MPIPALVFAAGIAFAYVFWPIVGKWSGVSGFWVTFTVMGISLVPIVMLSQGALIRGPYPSSKSFGLLVLAGVLNGLALCAFGVKASDPRVPVGVFVSTINVLVVVLACFADYKVTGANLAPQQIVGVVLAVVAVYLIAVR